jgi:hypothetical protein
LQTPGEDVRFRKGLCEGITELVTIDVLTPLPAGKGKNTVRRECSGGSWRSKLREFLG